MYVCMYVCMCVYLSVSLSVCLFVCLYVCMYFCMYACTLAYSHVFAAYRPCNTFPLVMLCQQRIRKIVDAVDSDSE